ncbi:tetraspanin-33-like isoform X3 [Uloborus diversus]|uniref:tetraspanin-33-like isoform X3 n=1 Tax=Uloborus diversus TaxID=327109 RepID=UPI00240940AC|nr:tetraspanin-33-like isoform X3 [Uloborus diversus]
MDFRRNPIASFFNSNYLNDVDNPTGFVMITEDDFIPKCMKLSVFFMNCIYWFLGLFVFGVGLHIHVYQMQLLHGLVTVVISPALIMMGLGLILFLIAVFGCVGTLRENDCLLRWYLMVLTFLLMVYVTMGAVSFLILFTSHTVHDNAEGLLQNALMNYEEDQHSADYIDYIQATLQCCGIGPAGYKDWGMNPYYACQNDNKNSERCGVPASCCKFNTIDEVDAMCGYGTTNDSLMTQLCGVLLSARSVIALEDKVEDFWKNNSPPNKVIHLIPTTHVYQIPDPNSKDKKGSAATDPPKPN